MSPLNEPPLPLEPEVEAVKAARVWVVEAMHRLGRDDLADSAELGVSELVTNAILHATPPIQVRVRGTRRHPRVEVLDRSPLPPAVNEDMAEDAHRLQTFGRGLGIIAVYSVTWGAAVAASGKAVWFEPSAQARLDGEATPGVLNFEDGYDDEDQPPPPLELTVELRGMPAQMFAELRQWYLELRRELLLLALVHADDYPVARDLADLEHQTELERRTSTGLAALDAAIAAGQERVDLTYEVPGSTPATMGRLLTLLGRADEFCQDQRLLSLAATPQQRDLMHWYLGEFVRQGAGRPPIPWPGGYVVERRES